MTDEKDYSLLRHNTFGIDAKCKRFMEYGSVEEAQAVVGMLTETDRPLLILGGGSNLLLTGDYDGTVLHSGIRFLDDIRQNDCTVIDFTVARYLCTIDIENPNLKSYNHYLNIES